MSKQRRKPQMCMPEPQVCTTPKQPAFQAFSNAEMCEMVNQSTQPTQATQATQATQETQSTQATQLTQSTSPRSVPAQTTTQDGYSAPGTIPTALNLMSTIPTVRTGLIKEYNTGFLQNHTRIDHASGMRHNKTGQYRTNTLKDVPELGPGGMALNAVNTGLGLYSLYNNAKCTANSDLGWEDQYQCGVGGTADIAGLTPFVPAQMFSTAVGLQQYGAGDIHKQTDTIAQQGKDVRNGLLDIFGDNIIGQGVSELGGGLTVIGSSLVHGVGNYGKAGYKLAESTVDTAGDIVNWGIENARPASIEEAVQRANSGCLTHASHKAGVYLDGMGLDRQGQYKRMNDLEIGQDPDRDLFGSLKHGVGGNTQQESAKLSDEQKDMLLKYLMQDPSKSSNDSAQ